jgi:hypothetical protein
MKALLGRYVPFLPIVAILIFFVQMGSAEAQNTDIEIVQNARTHGDHDNLSNYYDNLAKELVAKAEEKRSH